jgi:hypothetical protein
MIAALEALDGLVADGVYIGGGVLLFIVILVVLILIFR